jgi:outer membrane protein assembly factor BamB
VIEDVDFAHVERTISCDPMTTTRLVLAATIAAAIAAGAPRIVGGATTTDWLQWGGPGRNFMPEARGLASSWPPSGPKRLWTRPLGEGHSAILAEGARIYTMYRPIGTTSQSRHNQDETVAALDAATGKTVWEFSYPAATDDLDFSQGAGPHSTPLIGGNRIYAMSTRKELFALDKATGARIWSHDFMKEYGSPSPGRGYASSPILYNGTVIVSVGGRGQGTAAFNQDTGALVWKAGDYDESPASPLLIDVDGQPQLVVFAGDRVAGLDPGSGRVYWHVAHKTDWGLNISTPVWSAADHLLFVSSAYSTGSRAIELRQSAGKTAVAEKWFSNRMRVHIGTIIRLGDHAYASSGDFGPAFLSAIDLKTGKVAWQDRSFSRAQLLYADGKLIILDEDGHLGLATVSPQGLTVLSRAAVLANVAWTPPTLAGTTLYVRDRKNIAAFNLGS